MVSHSGQEVGLQVLEVSSKTGLARRGRGASGQGHAGFEDVELGSGAFGRKKARCKAQQKPESSWLSSGGVTLPGKNSSKVEPGLSGGRGLPGLSQISLGPQQPSGGTLGKALRPPGRGGVRALSPSPRPRPGFHQARSALGSAPADRTHQQLAAAGERRLNPFLPGRRGPERSPALSPLRGPSPPPPTPTKTPEPELWGAGAPPQRTAPGKRKSPAPPQSGFESEPKRGMQAGVPSGSGPTNRRYSPDPVLPSAAFPITRNRLAAPSARAGASPRRPAGSQPEPAALQAAPPSAPQPLHAPQPGQGKRHAQPHAPTPIYPSRWAPGASMFLGDRERQRNGGGGRQGCGRPAGSRLCSPAGGAYGAPGRRPQPHRAAPRHAAPHLARLRTRIKGAGGDQSRAGGR
ncbi:translation initiation factor IF-2-like [Lontra canadensis]|uniref:translation initiation factor IF-2-like n=1 Tax=Lontra canadensis TaxID=76717 RepID=UPI0013F30383|nr:translation initiation factor IF-2-like [Lontra canadensis]